MKMFCLVDVYAKLLIFLKIGGYEWVKSSKKVKPIR